MRIAVVSRGFSSHKGGAERFTNEFCKKLSEAGHEICLLCGEPVTDLPPGVEFRLIRFFKTPSFLKIHSFHREAGKLLTQEKFDLVYGLCQFYPLDFFYAGGGVHRHWMKIRYPSFLVRFLKYLLSPVHLFMSLLEDQIFNPKGSAKIITNSKLVKRHIMDYYGLAENRLHVIYDGVDRSIFHPGVRKCRSDFRKRLGLSEKDILLLFASNNWQRKGLDTILNALSTLPDEYKLIVAGRGKIERYAGILKKLHLSKERVKFIGTTDEIQNFYGMSDIFVLPTMYDPFAQVCREAMSCGLPVITAPENGAAEIIREGETGFVLASWDDVPGLSDCLLKLQSPFVRQMMGEKASEAVAKDTWEGNIQEHLKLFTQTK